MARRPDRRSFERARRGFSAFSICVVGALACGAPDGARRGGDAGVVSDGGRDEPDATTRHEPDGASTLDPPDAATQTVRDAGAAARDAATADAALPDTRPPAACPASELASAAMGVDAFVANTGKTPVSALTYTNVGADGAYAEVIEDWSKATGCVRDSDGSLCKSEYKREKRVSGALAPFNEEMTFVFAGPIELYQLAVYSPDPQRWVRRAYWDRCVSEGLAFTGNKSWFECGGNVQSYVSADGTQKSAQPVQFSGQIAAGTEVHVMSSTPCASSAADGDCGYSSGLALHGFAGDGAGSKLFVTKLRMPLGDKTPAYWILPSQVVRSSQYGCNCRGAGSDPVYKGGCGELDVAEILGGITTSLEATTTLYSFQDITGGGSVAFNRPVKEAATFAVIFDATGRQIAIRRLAADAFDFAASLPADTIAALLADRGSERALD